jgi:tryptophan-rich sensory protein
MKVFDRPDEIGLSVNVLVPLAAALIANALIFAGGFAQTNVVASVRLAPPGWAIGAVWTVLYVLYGIARWTAATAGPAGRRAAWWVVLLMGWGLAFPILTRGFDLHLSAYLNAVSLALTMLAIWRVARASRQAAAWLLPSLAWIAFANYLTLAKLASL